MRWQKSARIDRDRKRKTGFDHSQHAHACIQVHSFWSIRISYRTYSTPFDTFIFLNFPSTDFRFCPFYVNDETNDRIKTTKSKINNIRRANLLLLFIFRLKTFACTCSSDLISIRIMFCSPKLCPSRNSHFLSFYRHVHAYLQN